MNALVELLTYSSYTDFIEDIIVHIKILSNDYKTTDISLQLVYLT